MSSLMLPCPVEFWEYRDMAAPPVAPAGEDMHAEPQPAFPTFTEEHLQLQIQAARREAEAEAEQRWATHAGAQEARRSAQISATLEAFAEERTRYFRHVEGEVVHLTLAIARKILQREAQLDPSLLAALVRLALDGMSAGPAVRLHVPPAELVTWKEERALKSARWQVEIASDEKLSVGECVVVTEMGSAQLGFEAQLKEIEQGLIDLLAQRPDIR